jgi:uncharacterized membrane protein
VNLAHLHLLLNHFPTIGFGVALGVFVVALVRKSEDLKRASLVLFFVVAVISIPAYLSGNAADFTIREQEGVSAGLVTSHQDAAMFALIFMELTGFVAWLALLRPRSWSVPATLVLSILTFLLMARAANIGGEIRHPEILADGSAGAVGSWPRAAAMGAALVVDNPWVWPICEILHFVGLCLLFGVVLMVNLRMLGVFKAVPFGEVYRLMPWAMLGLAINVVTGMLFFLAVPDQYTQNRAFSLKMFWMMVGIATLFYPTVFEDIRSLKENENAPLVAKIVAVGSICIWIGVIFYGRFLPFLGSE